MPSIFLPRKEGNQPHGWLQLTSTAEIPDEFLKGVAMKFHEHSIDDIHHLQSQIEEIVEDAIRRSIRDNGIVKDFVMNFSLDIHTYWNDIEGKPDLVLADHNHSYGSLTGYWQDIPGLEDTIQELANMSYINDYFISKTDTNSKIVIKTDGEDFILTDSTNSGLINYFWRDNSTGRLYIGTPEDIPTTREDLVTSSGENYWHDGNKPAISSSNVGGTLVQRASSGDINVRYVNMSHGVSARSSDTIFYSSTDDYIRKTNKAGMIAALGLDALYLPIGGKAADADRLDGIQGWQFLRSDVADWVTGPLYHKSNTYLLRLENDSYPNHYLAIGGWSSANSNSWSRIRNSSSNLHIDSAADGNLYLNHYSAGKVYVNGGNEVWHDGNKPAISQSNVGGSLVQRNSSGDIQARLFRSEYAPTNGTINYVMTQIDPVTNNYIRPSTPAQFRAGVTDGVYLPIGGKANDSAKLDNLDSSQFLRSDATDVKTAGYLRFNDDITQYFGSNNDAAVIHDGNNFFVQNGTGGMYIREGKHGGWIYLQAQDASGVNKACAYFNAEYQRFFGDNSEKMRVTSLGVRLDHIYSLNGDTVTIGGGEMGGRLADPSFTLFSERLYLGAEGGLKVISSPDNLASWPNRHEATICDSNGNSAFPGQLSAERIACGYNPGYDNSIGCSGWFRSSGDSGWINATHGGGIYMIDSTWVRTYHSKSFYTGLGNLRTDGKLQIDGGNLEIDHINDTAIDNYVGSIYYRNYAHGRSHYFQAENTSGTNRACAYFNAAYQRLFTEGVEKLRTTATGITVFGAVATSSSKELKNILDIPKNALDKIKSLNPVVYAMKDDETQKPQIGLIAEDTPDDLMIAQKGGEPNERAINYDRLGVWAIAAIKELLIQVKDLERKVTELEARGNDKTV